MVSAKLLDKCYLENKQKTTSTRLRSSETFLCQGVTCIIEGGTVPEH